MGDDNKRYYWLKLSEEFFKDKPIKKLRKIAGGDTYTIIYLKMLLISLANNGLLFYDGIEGTFEEELALELDEDEDNVRVAVRFLREYGYITEQDNDEFLLTRCADMVGTETAAARRKRKSRNRNKIAQECDIVTLESDIVTPMSQCVTKCHTEIEIDKEKELEKELDIDISCQQIVDEYHNICVSLPKVRILSDARKRKIKTRLTKYSIDDFTTVFERAESSDFLSGRSGAWQASFDWLIEERNMIKTLEGNYDNKAANGPRNLLDELRDC